AASRPLPGACARSGPPAPGGGAPPARARRGARLRLPPRPAPAGGCPAPAALPAGPAAAPPASPAAPARVRAAAAAPPVPAPARPPVRAAALRARPGPRASAPTVRAGPRGRPRSPARRPTPARPGGSTTCRRTSARTAARAATAPQPPHGWCRRAFPSLRLRRLGQQRGLVHLRVRAQALQHAQHLAIRDGRITGDEHREIAVLVAE